MQIELILLTFIFSFQSHTTLSSMDHNFKILHRSPLFHEITTTGDFETFKRTQKQNKIMSIIKVVHLIDLGR